MTTHPQHLGVQVHGSQALAGLVKTPAVQACAWEALTAVSTAMEGPRDVAPK
jgi:hypothetical protein